MGLIQAPADEKDGGLDPLGFDDLAVANQTRCREFGHGVVDWTPTDWATAMAGECGEACNLIKKLRRGEDIKAADIGDELADLVIYADLLAARLDLDLGACVRLKFNKVSRRRGLSVFLRDSTHSEDAE